jgi:pimeloyl-ACP methyl ester carboxylesterase
MKSIKNENMSTDNNVPPPLVPSWVDGAEYPFQSHWLRLSQGRMHYVDEGAGEVLLFVHGNPSWSFEYRRLIRHFVRTHRCIAIDHLGFGLSDKPVDASYLPQFHASNLARFIDELGLINVTLVVHDWGGPIAMSYALQHAGNVRRIVACNSWFFSVRDQVVLRSFSRLIGGPLGRLLIRRFNLFARVLLPASFGDKRRLTHALRRQFTAPFPTPASRKGTWVFPRAIIGESAWLETLWELRAQLAHIPVLLLWGMKDPAFAPLLPRWQRAFPNNQTVTFDDVGHNVPEELGDRANAPIEAFLASHPGIVGQ